MEMVRLEESRRGDLRLKEQVRSASEEVRPDNQLPGHQLQIPNRRLRGIRASDWPIEALSLDCSPEVAK